MATHAVFEVTDGTLDLLADRPEVVAAFPGLFVRLISSRRDFAQACHRCGDAAYQAKRRLAEAYNQIKGQILTFPPEKRAQFKQFLDADKLRFMHGTNSTGLPVRHTL